MTMRASTIEVPLKIVQKWQEILNLIAEIVKVPAALIMKVEPPNITVFVSSKSPGNPYHPQERASLDTGLYCETVMSTRAPLLVPDALADAEWCSNPDVKLGMISYLGFPITWPNGEIFGTLCVLDDKRNDYNALYQNLLRQFRDVLQTDLKAMFELDARLAEEAQAAEVLRRANERMELAVRGSNVGVWESEWPDDDPRQARFHFVNFWEQLGYEGPPAGEPIVLAAAHPEDRARVEEAVRRYFAGETAEFETEVRFRHKDRSYRTMLARGAAAHDAAGKPVRFVGIIVDITRLKLAEAELRQAMQAAKAANRAKDEFLANVSHEIRTPMNAILGMTELVLDSELSDDQRQCLHTVKSAADNLLGLLNDLLDFSKIEAGKLELDPAAFSLRVAVGDTLRALAPRAHKKGLELISHVQPDVPEALIGDAGRLRQILLNLVGNAIKFTEHGEVVVEVGRATTDDTDTTDKKEEPYRGEGSHSDTAEHPTAPSSLSVPSVSSVVPLHFSVRDTGIGIPQDQQARIFRAFEQQDTSTTRKYGGTGLGLTIASQLVALMGGAITVDSTPGRGSAFTFTARFGQQLHPPEQIASRPPVLLHDLPVLVVDDNATNRHILEEWLRGWKMQPAAVGDGLAALDALWSAVNAGRPYPLVLLDARMPDVDGLALAAKIRDRAELAATRVILLTSGDRPGDLARARELRINARLLKPVQPDELLETIYQVLRKEEGVRRKEEKDRISASDSSGIPHPSSSPLRVLVAEDNEFSAELLDQLLGRRGHGVRVASNGREALALAEAGDFDLLLLDVHMPELDGFQVVRAVREWERTTGDHLPIIALTARSRKEDRERCLAAGMDDFLAKPIQAANLWASIDRVLRKEEGRRLQDEKQGRLPSDSSFIFHPSSFGKSLLNPQVLWATCGGDAAILEKIGQTFRACLPDQLKAVQDALKDRDAPRLRAAAHKLTGMVAVFSTVVAGVASQLEDQAAQGHLEEIQPLVGQLETMVPELMRVVSGLAVDTLRQQMAPTGPPTGRGDGSPV
jgi:PAS domain S-box-containing protein